MSSEVFDSLGHYTWQLTCKWARYSHPNKRQRWIASRYYGKFCPSRDDKWVFGDRETGAYLLKHSDLRVGPGGGQCQCAEACGGGGAAPPPSRPRHRGGCESGLPGEWDEFASRELGAALALSAGDAEEVLVLAAALEVQLAGDPGGVPFRCADPG